MLCFLLLFHMAGSIAKRFLLIPTKFSSRESFQKMINEILLQYGKYGKTMVATALIAKMY